MSTTRIGQIAGSAALGIAALFAQQQAAQPPKDEAPVFRSDTRVVVCHTTVVDKQGHLVTNLQRDNFTVFDPEPLIYKTIQGFR